MISSKFSGAGTTGSIVSTGKFLRGLLFYHCFNTQIRSSSTICIIKCTDTTRNNWMFFFFFYNVNNTVKWFKIFCLLWHLVNHCLHTVTSFVHPTRYYSLAQHGFIFGRGNEFQKLISTNLIKKKKKCLNFILWA